LPSPYTGTYGFPHELQSFYEPEAVLKRFKQPIHFFLKIENAFKEIYLYNHKLNPKEKPERKTMSSKNITPADVIASNEKNPGSVLTWSPDKFRDLKKINKKAKFDVTWVNVQFVTESGKKVPCRLKVNNVILGSGAKAPQTKDEGDISNYNIQFKKLLREEIEGGDYVPRVRETPEAQKIEDKRVSKNIDDYLANNDMLIQALDILQTSFVKVAKEIIEADKAKTLKFTVRKDRKVKDTPICMIKQSSRYDEDNREEVALPAAIFRIKLPVYKKDGRIGQWNTFKDEFRDIVFDARKMTKKNGFKPVPAYVKKDKKKMPLDRKNVQGFITYKSLISGSINFDSATISKAGISLGNKFYDMYIIRHRSARVKETVTVSEITDMRTGLASDDEGTDDEIEDVKDEDEDDGEHTDKDDDKQAAPDGDDTSDGEELDGDDDEESDDEDDEDGDEDESASADKPKRVRKGAPLKKSNKKDAEA
jgi:hypothetical protein